MHGFFPKYWHCSVYGSCQQKVGPYFRRDVFGLSSKCNSWTSSQSAKSVLHNFFTSDLSIKMQLKFTDAELVASNFALVIINNDHMPNSSV
jgi:hypothetical protein